MQQFPVFTTKHEFTRRVHVGDNFGELMVIENDKDNVADSNHVLQKWFHAGLAKDNSAISVEKAKYNLISGYRIEMLDAEGKDNVQNMYFMLDGECHIGSKIQCTFLNNKKVLIACTPKQHQT